MSPELKLLLAAVASYLAANKTEDLPVLVAFLTKEGGYVEADAAAAASKISNPFLKMAAEWVVSAYGPELPTLLSAYAGDAYDQLVAFLQAQSK